MIVSARLALKKLKNGKLALTIPLSFKCTLLGIGLFIFISIVMTSAEEDITSTANIVPFILCGAALVSAGYHDQWIFDRENDLLLRQVGFFLLYSNRPLKISDLASCKTTSFVRGRPSGKEKERESKSLFRRSSINLSLIKKDGTVLQIESYSSLSREKTEKMARDISEYCKIPFLSDSQ